MHVLFVDDDEVLAQGVEMALRENGHECEVADLGKEALTLSKRNAYDIVVLDVGLPDIDGCHVARRMKMEGVKTPVLLHSGLIDPELTDEARSLGVEDFLAKPFSIAELIDRMEAILGHEGIGEPEPDLTPYTAPEPTPEPAPDTALDPTPEPPPDLTSKALESPDTGIPCEPGCPAHPNAEAGGRPAPLPEARPKTALPTAAARPSTPAPAQTAEAKPRPRPEAQPTPEALAAPAPETAGQSEPPPRPSAVAAARAALRAEPETPSGLQAVSEAVAEHGAKALAKAVTTARSAIGPKTGDAAESPSDAAPGAVPDVDPDPESEEGAGRLSQAMAKARGALSAEPLAKAVAKGRAALDAKPLSRFAADAKAALGVQPFSKAAAKARAALVARAKTPTGPQDASEPTFEPDADSLAPESPGLAPASEPQARSETEPAGPTAAGCEPETVAEAGAGQPEIDPPRAPNALTDGTDLGEELNVAFAPADSPDSEARQSETVVGSPEADTEAQPGPPSAVDAAPGIEIAEPSDSGPAPELEATDSAEAGGSEAPPFSMPEARLAGPETDDDPGEPLPLTVFETGAGVASANPAACAPEPEDVVEPEPEAAPVAQADLSEFTSALTIESAEASAPEPEPENDTEAAPDAQGAPFEVTAAPGIEAAEPPAPEPEPEDEPEAQVQAAPFDFTEEAAELAAPGPELEGDPEVEAQSEPSEVTSAFNCAEKAAESPAPELEPKDVPEAAPEARVAPFDGRRRVPGSRVRAGG
jgi:CheY-like chemotaxis protein